MFKRRSPLTPGMVLPAIVIFCLIVTGLIAILFFVGSRHTATTLPLPKTPELQAADVAHKYIASLEELRLTVENFDGDQVALMNMVEQAMLDVRVPAHALDKHLRAVIAIKKLRSEEPARTFFEVHSELRGLLLALTML